MDNPLVRETAGHRVIGAFIDQGALKRLRNTLVEEPLRRIYCACGWTGTDMTMRQAAAEHFGVLR